MGPVDERHEGSTSAVTLVDCTLRDGGYYNEWNFSPSLIRSYVTAMSEARVPIVELGFRTAETGSYMGPTAFTTDRFLESLHLPGNVTFGVMVNAKELVINGDARRVVDRLFRPCATSSVGLVRIAANFGELAALEPGVERLHELGYDVGVNLMQIASRTDGEIEEFGRLTAHWGILVAYFADSFGSMQPDHIAKVVRVLKDAFGGPVGCHAHDNKTLAFANSIAAVEAGATYVDATVLGMGRGPGNARTEYVAHELARRGLADLDPAQLLPLVAEEFTKLQHEHGWGSNIFYFLSAANGIHPTYIQEMTKDGRYSVDEIVTALHQLGAQGGGSFSRKRLEEAAHDIGFADSAGSYDARGWCNGKNLLIVGPGPAGVERRTDVEGYIRAHHPVVVALNAVPPVDSSLVDAYAICHPVRAVIDATEIAALDRPLFMPLPVQERILPSPPPALTRDYGLTTSSTSFEARPSSCTIPRVASFPYALALAMIGGAREVFLTGFDGFEVSDPRQTEMEQLFALFAEVPGAPRITALTKTNYPIHHSSIYAD